MKLLTPRTQGLRSELCEACELLKWKAPTPIQKEAIPMALQGLKNYLWQFMEKLV